MRSGGSTPPLYRPTTELRCLAQHVGSIGRGERPGPDNHCRVLIQAFPLLCQAVLDAEGRPRTVARWEEVGPALVVPVQEEEQVRFLETGRDVLRFGVRCTERKCKRITLYEVVSVPAGRRQRAPIGAGDVRAPA